MGCKTGALDCDISEANVNKISATQLKLCQNIKLCGCAKDFCAAIKEGNLLCKEGVKMKFD